MTAEPRVEELLATIRKAIDHDISELDKRGVALSGVSRVANNALQGPDADQDIAHLRSRVSRQRTDVPPAPAPTFTSAAPPKLEPRNNGVSAILSGTPAPLGGPLPPAPILRPSYSEDDATPRRKMREPLTRMEPPRFVPAPEPIQHVAPQHYAPQPQQTYDHSPQDVTWVEEQPYQPAQDPYYAQQPVGALMSPQSAYAAQASFQALANSLMEQMGGDGRLEGMARDMLQPMLKEWLDDNLPNLVEKLVRDEIQRVARRGR